MRFNNNGLAVAMSYRTLVIAFILIMTGCSLERTVKLDTRLPHPPAVKQMPLHMGVYYSPEFLGYTERKQLIMCGPSGRRDPSGIYFIFPVGTASRDLFDQIIGSMFTEITSMTGPLTDTSSVDALLEPQIEFFDWDMVCSKDYLSTGIISAKVSYVIHLYNGPDRHLVASLHVEGRSSEKPELCFKECRDSLAAEQAMQDAMARFITEFYEQPEVKRWLPASVVLPRNQR
jgi:hypothetical protein